MCSMCSVVIIVVAVVLLLLVVVAVLLVVVPFGKMNRSTCNCYSCWMRLWYTLTLALTISLSHALTPTHTRTIIGKDGEWRLVRHVYEGDAGAGVRRGEGRDGPHHVGYVTRAKRGYS